MAAFPVADWERALNLLRDVTSEPSSCADPSKSSRVITGLLGNKQHTLQNGTIRSHSEAYCKYLVQQLQVSITTSQLQCDPGAAVAAQQRL
jgi:hypothetical protein